MLNRFFGLIAVCALSLLAAACAPREVEVTRVVEVDRPVEVTRIVEVQTPGENSTVTEIVEVTRVVEAANAGPQGDLIVALSDFPNSLDMPKVQDWNAINAARPLYDSLVFATAEGDIVPALAEDWEISADGTEYTFFLRQGVTFHNGEPFNAAAVVFSWERGKNPDNRLADRWAEAADVEAIDDFTVRITTESPNPLFLYTIADRWAIVPPGYIAEVGEEGFEAAPVGTGPFRFVSRTQNNRLLYEANPNYWDPRYPKVKTLTFRTILESFDRVSALASGAVHIAGRLNPLQARELLGNANINVVRYPEDLVYFIAFNNMTTDEDIPTADPRVRLAMNYAIDRQTLISQIFGGYARLSTGLVTPANLGYDTTLSPYPYDPERAIALLTEAGFPEGFTIGMACPQETYENFEEVCKHVVNDLAAVGITVELEMMDSAEFFDLQADKKLPPLYGDRWRENRGEALPRLRNLIGGGSYSVWEDEELVTLLDQIGATVEPSTRAELYQELQQRMLEDPPFIYLYEPNVFEAINHRVQGYKPRADETYYLHGVSLVSEGE